MATIAIAPLQDVGHILPTLQLAKALSAAGHRVVYVVLADTRALAEREGFDTCVIAPRALPLGALDAMASRAGVYPWRPMVHAYEQAWRAFAEVELIGGHEDARLRAIGADLALCDRQWDDIALVFGELGVRVMPFAANLSAERTAGPGGGRARVDLGVTVAHVVRHVLAAGAAGGARAWWQLARTRRRAGRALAAARTDTSLVLCPRELELPARAAAASVAHVGPCIDPARHETPVDDGLAAALRSERPIVYAAIGTHGHRVDDPAFLRAIVDAARARDWQLILSLGNSIDPSELSPLPPNAIVRHAVPQLAVLSRARVAISHGGLGTVKECIWFGVPMLVMPNDYDQPDNAARVEYHRLGLTLPRQAATAASIGELVQRLLDEPAWRARAAAWSELFRARQAEARHVALITAALP